LFFSPVDYWFRVVFFPASTTLTANTISQRGSQLEFRTPVLRERTPLPSSYSSLVRSIVNLPRSPREPPPLPRAAAPGSCLSPFFIVSRFFFPCPGVIATKAVLYPICRFPFVHRLYRLTQGVLGLFLLSSELVPHPTFCILAFFLSPPSDPARTLVDVNSPRVCLVVRHVT